MIMAFILKVMVAGELRDTDLMYFRDIKRCSWFAKAIELGDTPDRQYQISAWCEPVMVNENVKFWD